MNLRPHPRSTNAASTLPALSPLLVAIALISAAALPSVHAQQKAAPDAKAAEAPKETLRPEVAKPLKEAQDLINAKQFAPALAKLAEVDAIAAKTPYEVFILERLRGPAAAATKDNAQAAKSFTFAFESGRLAPADMTQFAEAITSAHYLGKDFKQAAAWARRALEAGSVNPQTRVLLVQALLLADDNAAAIKEVNTMIELEDKAGRTPSQDMLRLAGTAALRADDDALYLRTLERLVLTYPTKDYWTDYIARVSRQPHIAERYMADVFRLKITLNQTLTASQYMFLARTSKQAGFPIDASRVMEHGFSTGILSTAEHKQFRDAMMKEAADDVRNIARSSADAANLKEGPGLFNAGLNYIYNGDAAKGLPLMEEGIKRPGIRRPEDARLRMGIAYALAGERAKAIETLAGVMSTEGGADVARLWTAYAKQPTSAPSAAPQAAPAAPAKAG